ncbi:Fur family transcriptional regulator [Loktanella salsilacus]|jgi:Fur family ferric uptake transcriptional regulator|uniref:Fur family transcriptional regulator n=1 Tax=Loktanella salsilacus TaxID=195913 RepID=UPI003704C9FD
MMTEPNSEELSTDPAQILREAGLRATQQRTSVLTILAATTDHPTVDDVYDKARQLDDTVSIATIYRTMLLLETAGLIRKLTFDDAPARYEMTPNRDHDHLIDIDTGELIEIPGREMSELRARIVNDLGYDVVSQHTILRGRRKQ